MPMVTLTVCVFCVKPHRSRALATCCLDRPGSTTPMDMILRYGQIKINLKERINAINDTVMTKSGNVNVTQRLKETEMTFGTVSRHVSPPQGEPGYVSPVACEPGHVSPAASLVCPRPPSSGVFALGRLLFHFQTHTHFPFLVCFRQRLIRVTCLLTRVS